MVNVQFFGQLTDITGSTNLQLADAVDTESLMNILLQQFPALADVKFAIAINNTIVNTNTGLSEADSIAFMPPFSGG